MVLHDEIEVVAEGPLVLDAERFAPANRKRLSGAGLRAFLKIARTWGLSEREKLRVLGFPARSTYHNWVGKAEAGDGLTLPADTLLRISAVLGVHKGLRTIFADEADGTGWLRAANRAACFGGQRPIDLLAGGTQDGLMIVRRHLDAWRGGTFVAPLDDGIEDAPWSGDDVVIVG